MLFYQFCGWENWFKCSWWCVKFLQNLMSPSKVQYTLSWGDNLNQFENAVCVPSYSLTETATAW